MDTPLVAQAGGLREIRLVGRGGTGVVTAGELLGQAAVREERHAQAIPTFGPERRGALSSCTLRISETPILLKCSSTHPDILLVIDATIWRHAPVTAGLAEGGVLVFNSTSGPDEVEKELRSGDLGYRLGVDACSIFTVDATGIAIEFIGKPITNTTMMGALAGATGVVGMSSLEEVLEERFGENGRKNRDAARAGKDRLRGRGG